MLVGPEISPHCFSFVVIVLIFCHILAIKNQPTYLNILNIYRLYKTKKKKISQSFDCNWIRTQNHLVLKGTLNHLAKLAK